MQRWLCTHFFVEHSGRGDVEHNAWGDVFNMSNSSTQAEVTSFKRTEVSTQTEVSLTQAIYQVRARIQRWLCRQYIWLALRQRWLQAPVSDEHNGEGDVSKMQNRSIQVEVTSLEIAFGKHTDRGDSSDLSDEGTHAEVTMHMLLWWALRRWLEALVRDKHMAKLVYQRRQTEPHRQRWHP